VAVGILASSLNGWLVQTSHWLYAAFNEYKEIANAQ
jgi:hypothetical protein